MSATHAKSSARPPADKFPLVIVLTAEQKRRWDALKASLGEKTDLKALLKLLEQRGDFVHADCSQASQLSLSFDLGGDAVRGR